MDVRPQITANAAETTALSRSRKHCKPAAEPIMSITRSQTRQTHHSVRLPENNGNIGTQIQTPSHNVVNVVSSYMRHSLLSTQQNLPIARLTDLVGADPFSFDGPGTTALVV